MRQKRKFGNAKRANLLFDNDAAQLQAACPRELRKSLFFNSGSDSEACLGSFRRREFMPFTLLMVLSQPTRSN